MNDDKKRYFNSRIIDNLDSQIASSQSSAERNVLLAQKAFALARHSLIAESRQIIRDLRSINQSYEARLSAWIMFAEGIIEHSESYDLQKTRDRIIRSHLVGQAANDPTLAGTAAAWLADLDFLHGRYRDSADYLEKAFAWSKVQDSEARSRASMVLGSAFYFAGDVLKGKNWIQSARSHAVASGDIAMQNIILFNSSALDASRLTLLDCLGQVDASELNFAVMSAQSVSNLNTALGISNQPSMIPVQRAELLTIQREWSTAISIFDNHIDSLKLQGQSKWISRYIAHRSWCKANNGDAAGARLDIRAAIDGAVSGTDPDDLYVLHLRVANTAERIGDSSLAKEQRALGQEQLRIHAEHQQSVTEMFSPIAERYAQ